MARAKTLSSLVLVVLVGVGCSRGESHADLARARDRAVQACGWDPLWVNNEPTSNGSRVTVLASDPTTVGPDRATVWPDRVVCERGEGGTIETVSDGGGRG